MQLIRDIRARRQMYEEFANREGDIVSGTVQQNDNRYTLLDLGRVEALLPQAEQIAFERYDHGARIKVYIVEVRKTNKGPQIVVSRTPPCARRQTLRDRGARDRQRHRRDQGAWLASPVTAARSLSRPNDPDDRPGRRLRRRARQSACATSRPSCAASASTSCPTATIPSSSSRPALQPARVRRKVRLDEAGRARRHGHRARPAAVARDQQAHRSAGGAPTRPAPHPLGVPGDRRGRGSARGDRGPGGGSKSRAVTTRWSWSTRRTSTRVLTPRWLAPRSRRST